MGEDQTMSERELVVPHRFCGPPVSGNGGWTAGALAAFIGHGTDQSRVEAWPAIRVALRQPPPLDTPMAVVDADGGVTALRDGTPVATANVVIDDAEAPTRVQPVPADEARAAMSGFPGLGAHAFPTCFVCGVDRAEGDGLRIFPGPVGAQDGAPRLAATWTPHPSVAEDFHTYADHVPRASLPTTWAALDCIGAWAGDFAERPMVLAGITARIATLPVIGEEHVVVGLARRRDGRKNFTASALYDSSGRLVGSAEHLWITVDPAKFS